VTFQRRVYRLHLPSGTLLLGRRTLVMGVINVTPDSFFSGSSYLDTPSAIAQSLEMERAGADLLDIGGESTRPGADPVSAEEEADRVIPVIQGLRGKLRIPISLDTQKAAVAQAGLEAGAQIINDISALRHDPGLAEMVRRKGAGLVLMHMRGKPSTMQEGPFARDVLVDVAAGLRSAVSRATRAGIAKSRILIDPGIGFGKRYRQNFEILARLPELAKLGLPLLIGTSRKTFLGWTLAQKDVSGKLAELPWPAEKRLWGTAATLTAAILGGAHIVRVHDVGEMVQVVRVSDAIAQRR
jgi:dihydropteroate synthase